MELPAELLYYFLRRNKSNINQFQMVVISACSWPSHRSFLFRKFHPPLVIVHPHPGSRHHHSNQTFRRDDSRFVHSLFLYLMQADVHRDHRPHSLTHSHTNILSSPHAHGHTHACTHTHTHTHTHAHTHTHTHTHTWGGWGAAEERGYGWNRRHMCVAIFVCVCRYMYLCVCVSCIYGVRAYAYVHVSFIVSLYVYTCVLMLCSIL